MVKVKSYSAAWLSKNTTGHQLFEPSSETLRSRALSPANSTKKEQAPGPRRTIAHKGTQVFVAAGREIRWGDLAYLKEQWSTRQPRGRTGSQVPGIKREESMQSIEDSFGLENVAGIRVSCVAGQRSMGHTNELIFDDYRLSRRAVQRIFGS